MKPYLFMDFDGVLNIIPRRNGIATPADETLHFAPDVTAVASSGGREYMLLYSSELITELQELIHTGAVNFIWLTSWNEDTQTALNPLLGFNAEKAPYLWAQTTSFSSRNTQLGKYWSLEDYIIEKQHTGDIKNNTPLIWVDDVATMDVVNLTPEETLTHITGQNISHYLSHPHLTIKTSPQYGMSRAELQNIKNFIQEHT